MASGSKIVLFLALSILALPALAQSQISTGDAEAVDQEVFITSHHRAELELIQAEYSNNTTSYNSAFRPYQSLDVWMVGNNSSFVIEFVGLETFSGNLTGLLTRLTFNVSNLTTLELIVHVGNSTYNFGSMSVSQFAMRLAEGEEPGPPTILESEVARMIFKNRVVIILSAFATITASFVFVGVLKRGKVRRL